MNTPYTHFGRAIIRTPAFPYSVSYDEIVHTSAFKDAIFYASPELYDLWESNKVNEEKKGTILKYCKRAKSRCTPFGLFSACSLVSIEDFPTNLSFNKALDRGHLRLDYSVLSKLLDSIDYTRIFESNPTVYLNNSSYLIGKEVRFVSYTTDEQTRRHYCIKSYELDDIIMTILKMVKNGDTSLNQLRLELSNQGATTQEAAEYLCELLKDKLLILKEELSTICSYPETHLFQTLETYMRDDVLYYDVYNITSKIKTQPIGNTRVAANELTARITHRFPSLIRNQILQMDMSRDMSESYMSVSIIDDCLAAIPVLIQYSGSNIRPENKRLQEFKDTYLKRYDQQVLPLLNVLDPDFGIGYDNELFCWESSGLLQSIFQSDGMVDHSRIYHDFFQYNILYEGIDLSQLKTEDAIDWSKYPETMAIFGSLYESSSGEPVIFLKNIGGTSGLNTLARFGYLSKGIENLIANISSFEQEHAFNHARLATIDILPNVKAGNVARRSLFRNQRLSVPNHCDNSVALNDLFVSVRSNRIYLTDRDGMEIIPCIDNALAYNRSELSIYKFLCDLQTQDLISTVIQHPFYDARNVSFIPRIKIGKIIIHRAEWIVRQDNSIRDPKVLKSYLRKKMVPFLCVIVDGDNELRIDYSSDKDLGLLYNYYKKYRKLNIVEDLLSTYRGVVKDEKGNLYSNEFVIPIHKNYD